MSDGTLNFLMYTQILVAVLIIVSVLLQPGDDGSGLLGGSGGESFRTKRGLERFLVYATIGLGVVMVLISFIVVKYSG